MRLSYTTARMAFKPNRELLNVNFEGYKLSEGLLSHVRKDLAEEVQVARLKEEDYSYQHMRAYSLHNHLAIDPYQEDAVYWYTADGKIQQGTYKVSERDTFVIQICGKLCLVKVVERHAAHGLYTNLELHVIGILASIQDPTLYTRDVDLLNLAVYTDLHVGDSKTKWHGFLYY